MSAIIVGKTVKTLSNYAIYDKYLDVACYDERDVEQAFNQLIEAIIKKSPPVPVKSELINIAKPILGERFFR